MVCIVVFIDLVEYLPGNIIVYLLEHLLILFEAYVLDVSQGPFVMIHITSFLPQLLSNILILLNEPIIFVTEFLGRQKLPLFEPAVSIIEWNHLVAGPHIGESVDHRRRPERDRLNWSTKIFIHLLDLLNVALERNLLHLYRKVDVFF